MVATHFEVAVSLVITRHPDLIIYNRSSQGQKDAELINILQGQISTCAKLLTNFTLAFRIRKELSLFIDADPPSGNIYRSQAAA